MNRVGFSAWRSATKIAGSESTMGGYMLPVLMTYKMIKPFPYWSMYGMFTHIWLIFLKLNVGNYSE